VVLPPLKTEDCCDGVCDFRYARDTWNPRHRAIAVGLRTAAGQAVQGLENASVRALTKLEQVLPSRLRYRVRTLSQATVPLLTDQQPGVDPENLAVLAAATANRERVGFRYESADGTESRRMVEPHGLVSAGRRWYLVAYDTGREVFMPSPTGHSHR
jgi:predicted DNA-binding transcriptional regulator YafY